VAHSADLDKLLKAPYARALFLKPKEGRPMADTVNLYKDPIFGKEENWGASGLAVFTRAYSASTEYLMVVLWGYQGLDQVEQSVGTNTPARQLINTRLADVRDVVRIELWQRTDLGQ
jgi:hypothetical protein